MCNKEGQSKEVYLNGPKGKSVESSLEARVAHFVRVNKETGQLKTLDNGALASMEVIEKGEKRTIEGNVQMDDKEGGDKFANQLDATHLVEEALKKVEASMNVLDASIEGTQKVRHVEKDLLQGQVQCASMDNDTRIEYNEGGEGIVWEEDKED